MHRAILSVSRNFGRFPSEIYSIGKQHRIIEVGSGNKAIQAIIRWLRLEVVVRDISGQISNKEFEEMVALYGVEYDERPKNEE